MTCSQGLLVNEATPERITDKDREEALEQTDK